GDARVILTVVSPASVAGSLNQFRPPLVPVLLDVFRTTYDRVRHRADAIS
ncbi:MAG: hypothetical protein K0S99_766, partial [Thermomicrobiales bacterium]|nr:hypothetical protein [Thermomicrobiales bacterium]